MRIRNANVIILIPQSCLFFKLLGILQSQMTGIYTD